jgi:hypothetical protein
MAVSSWGRIPIKQLTGKYHTAYGNKAFVAGIHSLSYEI